MSASIPPRSPVVFSRRDRRTSNDNLTEICFLFSDASRTARLVLSGKDTQSGSRKAETVIDTTFNQRSPLKRVSAVEAERLEPQMRTATGTPRAEAQLLEIGFTREQVARLKELRQHHPMIEFTRSQRELNELIFLRWRYRTGRITS